MNTVLIVDADLGFVVWLGTLIADVGCQPLPAQSIGAAAEWARRFPINVLVIDPFFYGAAHFVRTLRRSNLHLKVIAVSDGPHAVRDLGDLHSVMQRPADNEETTVREWREMIQSAITPQVRQGGGWLS
jgi:hypothetical protein